MNTDDQTDQLLSSDRPETDPLRDRLGYAPFSRHLAGSIARMVPSAGLVMAVYGAWGMGKSTLINFVRHNLDELPEADRPIIVTFNPWWFSGSEDLTRRFFDQLRVELEGKPFFSNDVREAFADLADVGSKIPTTLPGVPVSVNPLGFIAKWVRPKKGDIVKAKEKISKSLAKQKQKILVVIDDIDRLTADETREIFRLVKSLADFPNTVYLLAFDRAVVSKMLGKSVEGSGDAYLEKIVQVAFELPRPSKASVRDLLTERIDEIIRKTADELFDRRRWAEIFLSGVASFIITPRDAVRLANTMSVTYPAVDGEVNIVDFVAIEALRTFQPEVYDVIRSNQAAFASTDPGDVASSLGYDPAEVRAFHDGWLKAVPDKEQKAVRSIIAGLFPKVQGVWADSRSGAALQPEWRRDRRVCSNDAFPAYFRLELPPSTVMAAELRSILDLTSDRFCLALKLADLAGSCDLSGHTRARLILSRLSDHAERDIPESAIEPTIAALFDVGDTVVGAEVGMSSWEIGSDAYISRIVMTLLRRLEPPQRLVILTDTITGGAAISTIVDVVTDLGLEHGKYNTGSVRPESQRLLTGEQLQRCESLAANAIRQAAKDERLADAPSLGSVLYRWRNWTDEAEPQVWVEGLGKTDAGLLRLLGAFQGRSEGTDGVKYYFDPEIIRPFISPDQIIERVRGLSDKLGITQAQITAIRTFIDGYERRKQGKDPREFFD